MGDNENNEGGIKSESEGKLAGGGSTAGHSGKDKQKRGLRDRMFDKFDEEVVSTPSAVKGSHEYVEEAANQLREQQEEERGKWANKLEFILACIGYTVGLGNLWRYPWLVYEYGGGSFLLAYWIIQLTIAYPTFLYELVIGQFSSRGPVHIWRFILPGFEGIGYALYFVMCLCSIYYTALFAVAVFYVGSSVVSPWRHCQSSWNSPYCFDIDSYTKCVQNSPDRWYAKAQCYDSKNLTRLIDSFQDCWTRGSYYYAKRSQTNSSDWRCSFQLQFNFTKTVNPCSLARDLSRQRPGAGLSKEDCDLLYGQFSTMNECLNEEKALSRKMLPTNVKMDFKFRKAENLKKMLNGSKLMNKLMRQGGFSLTEYLQYYCQKTQRYNTSLFSCFKSVIDPDESYSSEEYFTHNVNTQGAVMHYSWGVVLSWFIAWTLIALAMIKGIKTIGKLVYITATMPLLMILILVMIAATLPGFEIGVEYYMTTNWCKLKNPILWLRALSQIFFSLSAGTGGLSNMASYNKFRNDIVRDSIIISLFNCLFSFISGFGVFGVIGFMAYQVQTSVPLILRGSSTGVAFVVFAQSTCTLPGGQAVATFFFITLCLLAVDSELGQVELLATFIYDEFPSTRGRKWAVVMPICAVSSIVGLPFVSRASMEAVHFVDTGAYSYLIPIIAFLSIMSVMYVYGLRRFVDDVTMMSGVNGCGCMPRNMNYYMFGTNLKYYLYITWGFVAPVGIFVIMLSNFWSISGWYTVAICMSTTIPGFFLLLCGFVVAIYHRGIHGKALFRPNALWGPVRNVDRAKGADRYNQILDVTMLCGPRREQLIALIERTQKSGKINSNSIVDQKTLSGEASKRKSNKSFGEDTTKKTEGGENDQKSDIGGNNEDKSTKLDIGSADDNNDTNKSAADDETDTNHWRFY